MSIPKCSHTINRHPLIKEVPASSLIKMLSKAVMAPQETRGIIDIGTRKETEKKTEDVITSASPTTRVVINITNTANMTNTTGGIGRGPAVVTAMIQDTRSVVSTREDTEIPAHGHIQGLLLA